MITGRGKLIQVYDPEDKDSPSYWEHENTSQNATHDVPAGYKIYVVDATVKFE